MDEIDLGLHELSNQLSQDKTFFAESPSPTKTNQFVSGFTKSRYVQWMKTYFFYWTTAVFLFIFILWASPEYCYINNTVQRNNQPPTKQFLWSRFTTVFTISYAIVISIYLSSIYVFKNSVTL